MNITSRKRLNHQIRAFAHGTLKIDEDAYRQVIRDVTTGKEHITKCTDQEAELVLTALRRFHEGRFGSPAMGLPGRPSTPDGLKRQHKMLPRLMALLRWDWRATARFCFKVTGHNRTDKCNAAELAKVIAGMVQIVEHDLAAGKITMTDAELQEFRSHTQSSRSTLPPLPGEGRGEVTPKEATSWNPS